MDENKINNDIKEFLNGHEISDVCFHNGCLYLEKYLTKSYGIGKFFKLDDYKEKYGKTTRTIR